MTEFNEIATHKEQALQRFRQTINDALAQLEIDLTRVTRGRTGIKGGRPRAMFEREQVPLLREQGASWRQIARELGVGVTTVRRAYRSSNESR
jgi:DNA invertase Pin-like site-specific DNA recombinase